MTEETLNHIRTRPRFLHTTDLMPEEFMSHVQLHIAEVPEVVGKVRNGVATIHIETPFSSYWKPQLAIRAEQNEETSTTEVRGVFGPSSEVWTLFMFLYATFGLGSFVLFAFYFSTFLTNNSENYRWAMIAGIVSLICLIAVYVLAAIGKSFAQKEMAQLRKFAEEALHHKKIAH